MRARPPTLLLAAFAALLGTLARRAVPNGHFTPTLAASTGCAAVFAALRFSGIHTLLARHNAVLDAGAVAAGRSLQGVAPTKEETNTTWWRRGGPVRLVDLSENNIGDEGGRELATALRINRSIQELHLSHNSMGSAFAAELASALRENVALSSLSLVSADMGRAGAMQLARCLLPLDSVVTKVSPRPSVPWPSPFPTNSAFAL